MIETVDLRDFPFRPREMLDILAQHGAVFIVIGGVAATLHGSPLGTADLDTVAHRTKENRDALARALSDLRARPIVSVDLAAGRATVVNQPVDAQLLDDLDPARLLTDKGMLDVMWRDDTVGDHEAWSRSAVDVEVDGNVLSVAALADLIASKEAAGRNKDRAGLPFLREILRRTETR